MPRYDFQCRSCGAVEEYTFSMAAKPDHLACGCGGRAESLISDSIEVLVKGNQYAFKLNKYCVPVGWEKGNTDAELQEQRYSKILRRNRKLAQDNKQKARKGGIELIAQVPREMDRLRKQQFGKDYYEHDTIDKLRRDGCLFE